MKKIKTMIPYTKKSVLLIALLMFFSSFSFSQSNAEDIDFYQSIFGMAKKQALTEFLQLDEDDPFWNIYDEYEKERKELGKNRIELLTNYANNYLTLTDEKTSELIEQTISQRKKIDKLIVSYYKKVKKSNGAKVAAQFYQLENYILVAIRVAILEEMPFIGEIDDN
jgi:hypothetical protein